MPRKPAFCGIPDNYSMSVARLYSLISRLQKTPNLMKEYDNIIKEQLREGIVEYVNMNESPEVSTVYYMPYREVVREESDTTRMRIVYDAGSKFRGPSLNDCLEKGPCMLPKIFDIIVRFRGYTYGITSVIQRAFLNIFLQPTDRNLVRFLWLDDIDSAYPKVVTLRFCTTVFGINSSPFILGATVSYHMGKYLDIDENVVLQYLQDLYMDDDISGAQTTDDGFNFYLYSMIFMKEGSFILHKWTTNNHELQQKIDDNEQLFGDFSEKVPSTQRSVLGVPWDVEADEFVLSFTPLQNLIGGKQIITKRFVLKIGASAFDPIGVLAPLVINLKLMFQELCNDKCAWDDELSIPFRKKWDKLISSLLQMEPIRIQRYYLHDCDINDVITVQLHGFSDASSKAYAAVVYLRIISKQNTVRANFVASKTRVAPLTEKRIPRLELLACLILSRLIKVIVASMKNVRLDDVICWTDSMDCIHWINNRDKIWGRFVQNRVKEIRENVPGVEWKHCPGKLNPADIPSRGISICNEENRKIWLHGPLFLAGDCGMNVSENASAYVPRDVIEEKVTACTVTELKFYPKVKNVIQIERYSSLRRLVTVTAYVLRFINNCKHKNACRREELLSLDENNEAMMAWVQNEQKHLSIG